MLQLKAINKVIIMIFRLCKSRLIVPNGWQKVLNAKTQQLPKINFHHTSSCCFKQNKINENVKFFHQKQPAQKNEDNLMRAVVASIRNNPYVRIARFDRPIGKF